jgi:hypothetical protein
LSQRK